MNFFKLYIGDYQRDTGALTLAEHGAYMLMLQTGKTFGLNSPPHPRRRQVWCLSVSGIADAQAARRGLQQGGDYVRRLFKLLVIRAYLLDLLPARTVALAFRLFDLKHE